MPDKVQSKTKKIITVVLEDEALEYFNKIKALTGCVSNPNVIRVALAKAVHHYERCPS